MNIRMLNPEQCCGCASCAAECPATAIEMRTDKEGFAVPAVNRDKCVECGACVKACPMLSCQAKAGIRISAGFLASGRDRELIAHSASGGAFAVMAKYIQENDGIVFGACCDDDFVIRHHGYRDRIKPMQGSKYVQSDMEDVFGEIKELLEKNSNVMFSGTPCQVAALKAFLGRKYGNLITVDIICHGVSAPQAFKQYINYLVARYKKKIVDYRFRNRVKYDASGYMSKTVLSNGRVKYRMASMDGYFYAYLRGMLFRKSCYQCPFATPERVSDITIGDCNTRRKYEDFHAGEPVSSIFPNTTEGIDLWNRIKVHFDYIPIDTEAEINANKQLNQPSKMPPARDEVCAAFAAGNFDLFKHAPFKKSFKDKLKLMVQSHISWNARKSITRILKRIAGR